jgi:hypothetical protein
MRILLLAVLLSGCAGQQPTHAPLATAGSVGTFDESAYKALVASNSLIERTKIQLATSATGWTPTQAADISHALAWAIDSQEKTQKAYDAYRQAVLNAGDSRIQFDALTACLADLKVKTSALVAAKQGVN